MIWKCLFSPRLYAIYRDGGSEVMYQPQGLEKWGDKTISLAYSLFNVGIYTSPFIFIYIYRRGFFTQDEYKFLANVFLSSGCLLALSFLVRAYGRAKNPKYMQFLQSLEGATDSAAASLHRIRQYDFDFTAWPVTFYSTSKASTALLQKNQFKTNEDLPTYQKIPLQVLAYVAVHTFGLRLIYPGSLGLLNHIFAGPLMQGRSQLVLDYNGQRAKINTADNNSIDTMFVDKRNSTSNGNILVICCEGNSGFYEVGLMTTPIKAGYSALGWNHPGFAASTGSPYPSQEQNAIDAVMHYAIDHLQFAAENIVMFGWSIGGYPASWAAVHYPVKALVLDATFDDLLHLAVNHMPSSWSRLVREVVRSHVDLHISALVTQYDGPVRLVRRTEDEIICMVPGQVSTNRGNQLAIDIIRHKHGDAVSGHLDALSKYANMLASQRPSVDSERLSDGERLVLTLLSRYMRDYNSTHCTPLPEQHFAFIMDHINKKDH